MSTTPLRPTTAAVTVLCLLRAAPLHPYGMQRLIKTWGKEDVVNIGQRANLYKTIKRLRDAGLIAVRQTERSKQYPERTVYELTAEGLAVGEQWLVDMLRSPRNEYPEFPAALSFAMGLSPKALADLLAQRLEVITAQLAELDAELAVESPAIPRIVLIESDYKRALVRAEVGWLSSTIDELRSGSFRWDSAQLIAQAQATVAQLVDL
jgi:DNA-binding PadR family transcriptional regulator